jgi:hypothetical protein
MTAINTGGYYSPLSLDPWSANTVVSQTEERSTVILGVLTGILSTAKRTTTGAFDTTEAGFWTYQGQVSLQPWVASSLVLTGFFVINNGQILRSLLTRSTGATVDAANASNWAAEPFYQNGKQFIFSNFPSSGSIGAAATTVDVATEILFNQVATGVVISLPAPTLAGLSKKVSVTNLGTAALTIGPVALATGETRILTWNTTAWSITAPASVSAPASTPDFSLLMA